MTLRTPKISVRPAATRNSSIPMISPPVACVMTQAEEERQLTSAAMSTGGLGRRGTDRIDRSRRFAPRRHRQRDAGLGEVLFLFPLGFERENLVPISRRHFRHVGLGRNGGSPSDGVSDQSLILGPQRQLAVGAERRRDRQSLQYF